MTSTQIEYFFALSKYLNYSETARRLFVSQSTISKQIAALESELELKLFSRKGNSLALTAEGEIMLQAFGQAKQIISDAKASATDTEPDLKEIYIGIPEGIGVGPFMEDSFKRLEAKLSNRFRFHYEFMTHKKLNQKLADQQLDIALTLREEITDTQALEYRVLQDLPHGIIAHKSLSILDDDGNPNYDRMHALPYYVAIEGSRGVDQYLEKIYQETGIDRTKVRFVPNVSSVMFNVGLGRGIGSASLTPHLMDNPDLDYMPLKNISITIVAAWNKYNKKSEIDEIIRVIAE